MEDTTIAQVGRSTLIVRDRDGDDAFEPAVGDEARNSGDRIGLRISPRTVIWADSPNEQHRAQVAEAMREIGLEGILPNGRIPALRHYVDQIRLAQRAASTGNILDTHVALRVAEDTAGSAYLRPDIATLNTIRWQTIQHAELTGVLRDPALRRMILTLRKDSNLTDRAESARLVLSYLSVPNQTSFNELQARCRRLSYSLSHAGRRETTDPQQARNGQTFRVGQTVHSRNDPNQSWIISGFQLNASGIIARSVEGPHGDIEDIAITRAEPRVQQAQDRTQDTVIPQTHRPLAQRVFNRIYRMGTRLLSRVGL